MKKDFAKYHCAPKCLQHEKNIHINSYSPSLMDRKEFCVGFLGKFLNAMSANIQYISAKSVQKIVQKDQQKLFNPLGMGCNGVIMNRVYVTVLYFFLQSTFAHSATTYICQNQQAEMVVTISEHNNPKYNSFVIDSPEVTFTSSGKKLQFIELSGNLIIQAIAISDQNLFAHIVVPHITTKRFEVSEHFYETHIRVNNGSVVETTLMCQAISAAEKP